MELPDSLIPVVVVVCSSGRPHILHESMVSISAQSEPCDVVLSVQSPNDVLEETAALPRVTVVMGSRGSSVQRNRALQSIPHQPECVLFLDDDVELDGDYVRELLAAYRRHPEIAVMNGRNLAHGIHSAGTLDRQTAVSLLEQERARVSDSKAEAAPDLLPMNTSYGCRMSMRGDLLGKVEFDERLVLYGFLEDLDFAIRCLPYGAIAECQRANSVHLEVSADRIGGRQRGYSDIINPLYIWSKRTGFPLTRALLGSLRRTVRNVRDGVRSGTPSRVQGNLLGWRDAILGRLRPERILTL